LSTKTRVFAQNELKGLNFWAKNKEFWRSSWQKFRSGNWRKEKK